MGSLTNGKTFRTDQYATQYTACLENTSFNPFSVSRFDIGDDGSGEQAVDVVA